MGSRDVRYWAEQFRERSPVDISDLEAIEDIPKYCPEEIRREFARYFPQDDEGRPPAAPG